MARFSCAHTHWIAVWTTAIMTIVATVTLCIYVENAYAAFFLGIVAIYLNIVNVLDAPEQLQASHITFTPGYIISTNAIVISMLLAIDQLIERGYVKWAGVAANVPILAIILLSGASCMDTEAAIRTITQHIYMLAYQTWPMMSFVGVLWGAYPLGTVISLSLASVASLVVLFIQYSIVKTKL